MLYIDGHVKRWWMGMTTQTAQIAQMAQMAQMAPQRWLAIAGLGTVLLLSACESRVPLSTPANSAPAVTALPSPTVAIAPASPAIAVPPAPGVNVRPAPPAKVAVAPARNWDEYRVTAAKRIVAANQQSTYMGDPPEPLLAIPVLEIELHADGSVQQIKVLRVPSQATDTVQLAIAAVRRAAPFGDVSRLPKPWKFSEVFLFDDDRRFKPRSLEP